MLQKKLNSAPTLHDLYLFFQQFATLMSAGVAILPCFDLLLSMQHNSIMRSTISSIRQDILAGKRLFTSFQNCPHFDALICQLVHIGEQTGKLDNMLHECKKYLDDKIIWRNKLKKTLSYPIILIFFASLITIFIMIFIVPRFSLLFSESNIPLPLLTRSIFYLSACMREYFMWMLLCMSLISCIIYYARQAQFLRTSLQHYFITLPGVKNYYHLITLARFCRYLALLLQAGITLTMALQILTQTSSSPFLRTAIHKLQIELRSGTSFHHALQLDIYFPELLTQFAKIGEQSGTLDSMLNQLAYLWECQIDTRLTILLPMLEPLIMIVLGVLIGGIVISLYLPIFKLGSTI